MGEVENFLLVIDNYPNQTISYLLPKHQQWWRHSTQWPTRLYSNKKRQADDHEECTKKRRLTENNEKEQTVQEEKIQDQANIVDLQPTEDNEKQKTYEKEDNREEEIIDLTEEQFHADAQGTTVENKISLENKSSLIIYSLTFFCFLQQ